MAYSFRTGISNYTNRLFDDASTTKNNTVEETTAVPPPIADDSEILPSTDNDALRNTDINNTVKDITANVSEFDPSAYANTAKSDIDAVDTNVTSERVSEFADMRGDNKTLNMFRETLDKLQKGANEGFEVDKNIADRELGRFDATTQAANLANAQRMAANPNISQGARNAFRMEAIMTQASQRSVLAGDLAIKAQERSFEALKKLSEMSLAGAQFDEVMLQNDIGNVYKDIDNDLKVAVAKGDITMKEAQMEFEKIAEIANTQMEGLKAEINKNIALADNELDREALKAQIKSINNTIIDSYETRAKGIVQGALQITNPDGTVRVATPDELATNSAVVDAVGSVYKQLFNRVMDMDNPSDRAYFNAYVSQVKTPTQQSIADFREEMTAANVPAEIQDAILADVTTTATAGGVIRDTDGTISLVDPVTGTPILSYKKDENGIWQPVSDVEITSANEDGTPPANDAEAFDAFLLTVPSPLKTSDKLEDLYEEWELAGNPPDHKTFKNTDVIVEKKDEPKLVRSIDVSSVVDEFGGPGSLDDVSTWRMDELKKAIEEHPDKYVINDPGDTDRFYKNDEFVPLFKNNAWSPPSDGFNNIFTRSKEIKAIDDANTIKADVFKWINSNLGQAVNIGGRVLIPAAIARGNAADSFGHDGTSDVITFFDPASGRSFRYDNSGLTIAEKMRTLGIIKTEKDY